jgi:hypothetical protein
MKKVLVRINQEYYNLGIELVKNITLKTSMVLEE